MRLASHLAAALVATVMVGCQLIIGLDGYYLAPACPDGATLCATCNDAADCGPADVCHTWSCVEHLCQPIDAAPGTACSGGVCSDESPSTCVPCNEDADCAQPGGHCFLHACFRCDDGIENGDEHEVDCGGACPWCQGDFCSNDAECITGFFCTDGVCCNAPCDEVCASCFDGDCKAVPRYQDDWPTCAAGMVCNGGGECRIPDGGICMSSVDCASGKCDGGQCVP